MTMIIHSAGEIGGLAHKTFIMALSYNYVILRTSVVTIIGLLN